MLKTICLTAAALAELLPPAEPRRRAGSAAVSLGAMRDRYRPVLVFQPARALDTKRANDAFLEQLNLLAEHRTELKDRDVVVITVTNAGGRILTGDRYAALPVGQEGPLKRRFHIAPGDFAVILIGKDGGEKFRSDAPVTIEKLDALIDAMPMRQQEVRDGHHPE